MPHTACRRGKKVMVTMLDGERFLDHFWERTDKYVAFKSGRKVHRASIRAFVIYKPSQPVRV